MKFGGSMLTTHLRHFPNLNNRDQDWAQVFMYSKPYTKDTKVMYGRFSTNLLLKMFFLSGQMVFTCIWQCVKTNSTPVVHIKIAGLKWMWITP